MVFSSLKFLFVFLPVVLALYFLVLKFWRRSHQAKILALNFILVVSSLIFYLEGEKKFVWVMLLTGTIDYFIARRIEREESKLPPGAPRNSKQKLLLVTSIVANMGLLFYFKYIGFAVETFSQLARSLGASSDLHRVFAVTLPIGISFYTFESMSYIIDVYHRETRATRNLVNYWTFITFFPHLIAGPIIRYVDLKAQLESRQHSWENVNLGFRLFIVGLGKKVILANPLGYHADYLFALDSTKIDSLTAWLAVAAYTLQIYYDFSGYSDMARGLGKIFSIELPLNFNYPYISKSIQEFWRRWHITLSTWFRDYLYIPLGGSRSGVYLEYRNLLFVFFFCGLWHGASLNFIFWGLYHGFFLIFERVVKARVHWKLPQVAQHLYALVVVMFGWVLFRSDSLAQTIQFWRAMAGLSGHGLSTDSVTLLQTPYFFVFLSAGILLARPLDLYLGINWTQRMMTHPSLRYEFVFALILVVATVSLCGQSYNPFIYFRF